VGNGSGRSPAPSLTIGDTFLPRRNSLNFLRLALATAVIFSHAITLGGFGREDILGKTTLGTMAVYGFFGISGYLIAGSASRNQLGRYLWQRFLRIFPAFWVCLIVVALVFGTVAWFHMEPVLARRCGISCYLNESHGPVGYVIHNLGLRINQPTIAKTLSPKTVQDGWNGSLWTLFFEFLCYLLLAVLALLGFLRRRRALAVLAATAWLAEVVITSIPSLNHHFGPSDNWDAMNLLTFVPIFLAGSLLYLYRDRIPDSAVLAWICTFLVLLGLVVPLGNGDPAFSLTSMNLMAVFFAYPLLWLGIHLPFHKVGARNDYSYGVYIYAFPVQQLLVIWGANRWGYWPFSFLAVAGVAPLAFTSWWIVEKHALRLKTLTVRTRGGRVIGLRRHALQADSAAAASGAGVDPSSQAVTVSTNSGPAPASADSTRDP
jgi:peptidoglycan/LPS O-acetylase OafA/YrhL